jgi:hypothetical protein
MAHSANPHAGIPRKNSVGKRDSMSKGVIPECRYLPGEPFSVFYTSGRVLRREVAFWLGQIRTVLEIFQGEHISSLSEKETNTANMAIFVDTQRDYCHILRLCV